MKQCIFIGLLFLISSAISQERKADSLRAVLRNATTDSVRHNACMDLYYYYFEVNRDSALYYADKRLALAEKNNVQLAISAAFISKGYQNFSKGNYAEAYQNLLVAIKLSEDINSKEVPGWRLVQYPIAGKNKLILIATTYHVFGGLMMNTENFDQEINYLRKALDIAQSINHPDRQMVASMNLAAAYLKKNIIDSALFFAKKADSVTGNFIAQQYRGRNFLELGKIYAAIGNTKKAKDYYYQGIESSMKFNNQSSIANINHKLVEVYYKEKNKDSVIFYALQNIKTIESLGGISNKEIDMGVAYADLHLAYELNKQLDSAYKYLRLASVTKDSIYKIRIKNLAEFQKLSLNENTRLENLEKDRIITKSNIRTYGMLAGLATLTIIGIILYRNNQQKKKANQVLEATLTNLKSTQSQLIQSEKMASLGELTAGIAHEIQNPLNFVNNFSELNIELVEELIGNREKGIGDSGLENDLLNDIKTNSEKINHHGKRADGIVKGMLQHSRSSTGQKEPTDINALCDEYLRLAYHGLRAKDKTFNAEFKTEFDETIGKVNVQPQEMGRVILNLINNAFFAVAKQSEILNLESSVLASTTNPTPYTPTVTITTQKLGNTIEIRVTDNGTGIPQHIKEKIFQPFFTTKPTGQGTGLGLSLAYDIVTKGHSGKLEVDAGNPEKFGMDSKEGKGTTFIVTIPV